MKTYGDYADFFEGQLEALGGPFELDFQLWLWVLRRHWSIEADEACRVFAATRAWPKLSETTRLEVCCRLANAKFWCLRPNIQSARCGRSTEQAVIVNTLIDYWKDVGREDWLIEDVVKPRQVNPPGPN